MTSVHGGHVSVTPAVADPRHTETIPRIPLSEVVNFKK